MNGPAAAFALSNDNGPALRLSTLSGDWDSSLSTGELAATDEGLIVGTEDAEGYDFLVTGNDLFSLPFTIPLEPERVLNTRKASLRNHIIGGSSTLPLDSSGRLKAGAWIDIGLIPTEIGAELGGVFVNVAVIDPTKNGYLTAYAPGERPNVSTINFRAGGNVSNGALVTVRVVDDVYAVRIHSSQTTHVLLDISGLIVSGATFGRGPNSPVRARLASRQSKRAAKLRAALRS